MTLSPYQVHRDCAVMAFMLIKFSTSVYKVAFYGLRFIMIFSSPEPKAHGELIVSIPVDRAFVLLCVRPSVNIFKHEYL